MAAWIPIIKTALPIIADIVTLTRPIFTSKTKAAEAEDLTAQQIEELQEAATQNADSVASLAAQLQTTIEGLEVAALDLQKELKNQRKLTLLSILLAGLSLSVCVYLLSR